MRPKIDHEKCSGDGACFEVCPSDPNVFEIREGKAYIVNPDACIECGLCEEECPEKALTMVE